ncbi:hypothetical protein SLA2020_220770 [Shorea laevis]
MAVENPWVVSVEDEDKSSKEESEMECAAVDGEIERRIGEVSKRAAVRKRWNGRDCQMVCPPPPLLP